jgi:hypothetical protein
MRCDLSPLRDPQEHDLSNFAQTSGARMELVIILLIAVEVVIVSIRARLGYSRSLIQFSSNRLGPHP